MEKASERIGRHYKTVGIVRNHLDNQRQLNYLLSLGFEDKGWALEKKYSGRKIDEIEEELLKIRKELDIRE